MHVCFLKRVLQEVSSKVSSPTVTSPRGVWAHMGGRRVQRGCTPTPAAPQHPHNLSLGPFKEQGGQKGGPGAWQQARHHLPNLR